MTISDEWPLLQIPPCKFSDDDVAFHSDITYFRLLLDDIWEAAWTGVGKAKPFPIGLSDELEAATAQLKAVKW
jgi:hypothetical protein